MSRGSIELVTRESLAAAIIASVRERPHPFQFPHAILGGRWRAIGPDVAGAIEALGEPLNVDALVKILDDAAIAPHGFAAGWLMPDGCSICSEGLPGHTPVVAVNHGGYDSPECVAYLCQSCAKKAAAALNAVEDEVATLREELERERRRTADAVVFVRNIREAYVRRRASYINGETLMQKASPFGTAVGDFKLETIHAGGVLDGPIGAYNHAVGDMSTLLHILDGKGGK